MAEKDEFELKEEIKEGIDRESDKEFNIDDTFLRRPFESQPTGVPESESGLKFRVIEPVKVENKYGKYVSHVLGTTYIPMAELDDERDIYNAYLSAINICEFSGFFELAAVFAQRMMARLLLSRSADAKLLSVIFEPMIRKRIEGAEKIESKWYERAMGQTGEQK